VCAKLTKVDRDDKKRREREIRKLEISPGCTRISAYLVPRGYPTQLLTSISTKLSEQRYLSHWLKEWAFMILFSLLCPHRIRVGAVIL
jgi:hypothetical protein